MQRECAISISVVVVAYNEEKKIARCLESLVGQRYSGPFELIVIDNGSTDSTRSIVSSYISNYGVPLRCILQPINGIARSRQLGVECTRYQYIAFIDADCVAPRDWLETLADGFARHSDTRLAAVGGSNEPPLSTPFYRTLRVFLNSYLGNHGSVQGALYSADRCVDHLSATNVLYRKSAIIDVGGFDISLRNMGEDIDMSFRLREKKYVLYYITGSLVTHYMRESLSAWAKNMLFYGLGRVRVIQKHHDMLSFIYILPAALALILPFCFLFSLFHQIFLLAPALYFFIIVAYSVALSIRKRIIQFCPLLIMLFVATHLWYGAGEIYAALSPRPR